MTVNRVEVAIRQRAAMEKRPLAAQHYSERHNGQKNHRLDSGNPAPRTGTVALDSRCRGPRSCGGDGGRKHRPLPKSVESCYRGRHGSRGVDTDITP